MYKEYKMEKKSMLSNCRGQFKTFISHDSSQLIHFNINITIIDKVPTPVSYSKSAKMF